MTLVLSDLEAMRSFGHRIAAEARPGDVIALSGELGSGKTTLARAILAALGAQGEVPSPTFTIVEHYSGPHMRMACVHADFYRIEDPSEITELGLEEYREEALLVAEWPENVGGFAHLSQCLSITLEIVGQGRTAIVEKGVDWLERRL